ncbi:hypothetical protein, partial [Bacillus sp. WP8]|uniref:hypothetical protein n=1 Tax=Bacillus sp. WP8 TaxID=756828 RepID=UPI0016427C7A
KEYFSVECGDVENLVWYELMVLEVVWRELGYRDLVVGEMLMGDMMEIGKGVEKLKKKGVCVDFYWWVDEEREEGEVVYVV